MKRIITFIRCAILRWNISSTERYMAACERDGIMDTQTLRIWRRQMAADRVRLAMLEVEV